MQNTKNTAFILVILLLVAPLTHADTIRVINYAPYPHPRLRNHHPHRQAFSQIESLVDSLVELVEQAKRSESRSMDCSEEESSWDELKLKEKRNSKSETWEKDAKDGQKKTSIPSEKVAQVSAEDSLKKEIANVATVAEKIKLQIEATNGIYSNPEHIEKEAILTLSEFDTKENKKQATINSHNEEHANKGQSDKKKEVDANPIPEQHKKEINTSAAEKEINKGDLQIISKDSQVYQKPLSPPAEVAEKVLLTVTPDDKEEKKDNIVQGNSSSVTQPNKQDIAKQENFKKIEQNNKISETEHKTKEQEQKTKQTDSEQDIDKNKVKVQNQSEKKAQSDINQEKHNQPIVEFANEKNESHKKESNQETSHQKDTKEKSTLEQKYHQQLQKSPKQEDIASSHKDQKQKADQVQPHTSWPQISESAQQTAHQPISSLHKDEPAKLQPKSIASQTVHEEVKTNLASVETAAVAPSMPSATSESKKQNQEQIKKEQHKTEVKQEEQQVALVEKVSQIPPEANSVHKENVEAEKQHKESEHSISISNEKIIEPVKTDLPKEEHNQNKPKQQLLLEVPKNNPIVMESIKEENTKQDNPQHQLKKEELVQSAPVKEELIKDKIVEQKLPETIKQQQKKEQSKDEILPIASDNKESVNSSIVAEPLKDAISDKLSSDEIIKDNHLDVQEVKAPVSAEPELNKQTSVVKETSVEAGQKSEIVVPPQQNIVIVPAVIKESETIIHPKEETTVVDVTKDTLVINAVPIKQESSVQLKPEVPTVQEYKSENKVATLNQTIQQNIVEPAIVNTNELTAPVKQNEEKKEVQQSIISEPTKIAQASTPQIQQVLSDAPILSNSTQENTVVSEIKHIEQIQPESIQIIQNLPALPSLGDQLSIKKEDISLEITAKTDGEKIDEKSSELIDNKINQPVEIISQNSAKLPSTETTSLIQIQPTESFQNQTSSQQTSTVTSSNMSTINLPSESNYNQTKTIIVEDEAPFMPSICVPMCDFTSNSPICDSERCRGCRNDNECSEELSLFEVLSDSLTVTCHLPSGSCIKHTN